MPDGPYHPCIEELRNHPFVSNMRRHLDSVIKTEDGRELEKIAGEVERVAFKMREDTFKKYLAQENEFFTVGRAAATELAGLVLPGTGFVKDMIQAREFEKEKSKLRWAGFVVDIEALVTL